MNKVCMYLSIICNSAFRISDKTRTIETIHDESYIGKNCFAKFLKINQSINQIVLCALLTEVSYVFL